MNLYLDIETIPASIEQHEILRDIHHKKLKDGRKVSEKFADYLASTSLDGAFGRIVCIGIARDDQQVEVLRGQEGEILKKFWEVAQNASLFIGFNCMDFDLRFIYQRSVITSIMPTKNLSFARYRSDPIFDIMWEWRKWARDPAISLDTLAKALGIPSSKSAGFEGKDVAKAYEQGKITEICDYCAKDVEVTRQIYKKMTFGNQQKLPF